MKIKVTLGHIAKSKEILAHSTRRSTNCPIAIALKEMTGKEWIVGKTKAVHHGTSIVLPSVAVGFINSFDKDWNTVNPTEFDLPI